MKNKNFENAQNSQQCEDLSKYSYTFISKC